MLSQIYTQIYKTPHRMNFYVISYIKKKVYHKKDTKIRNLIKICNLILSYYHCLLADERTKINTVRKTRGVKSSILLHI